MAFCFLTERAKGGFQQKHSGGVIMSQNDLNRFLSDLQSQDLKVRQRAWQSAGPLGAPAVEPLAKLLTAPNKGVARAAGFALEKVAHYAARPGSRDRRSVANELVKAARPPYPLTTRRQALVWLGFIAEGSSVPELAKLLSDADVREEARMALERIPGSESLNALKAAMRTADSSFKQALEQSIQNRALTPQRVGIRATQKG
jgi:HEAT repeat protein